MREVNQRRFLRPRMRGDVGGDLVDSVGGVPVARPAFHAGAELEHVGLDGISEQGGLGGEGLERVQAAGGEPEDGDLGAGRHLSEVFHDGVLRVDEVGGLGIEGVEQEDVDGAGFGERLVVGIDVCRQLRREAGGWRVRSVEFGEAVDGLGLAVFGDGEVGLLEASNGIAIGIGDGDVDDDFASVELEGGDVGGELVGSLCTRPAAEDEDQGGGNEGQRAETHGGCSGGVYYVAVVTF